MGAEPEGKGRGRPRRSSEVDLAGSRPLDRRSPVPLYFQLAEVLTEIVETGSWPPGARFATEREIEEQFEVSRTVIRPALELLVGDGLIVRNKGAGAFLAPPKCEIVVTGLVKALRRGSKDLAIRVLSAQSRQPDRSVARLLELEAGVAVAHVTAIVNPGDRSAFLVYSFSSVAELPWLLPTAKALQGGAKQPEPGKLDLGPATISIEGTFFSQWGASQLGVSPGDPALTGRLVQYGNTACSERQQRPLEFARVIYRVDSAQLTIEVD